MCTFFTHPLLINDKFSSLYSYFQRPEHKSRVEIGYLDFVKNVFDWKCIAMLLHKEYYTIVLCYTGYWWQQTSRLLYVQSWKIHKKRSADHRRGKHFFLSFPTCLFTTLKRIRGAGGICQTDNQSHFNKVMRCELFMNFDWFGLMWQIRVYWISWNLHVESFWVVFSLGWNKRQTDVVNKWICLTNFNFLKPLSLYRPKCALCVLR